MPEKVTVSAESIAKALEDAAKKINQPVSRLKYTVLHEKKGFFGKVKQVEIEAWQDPLAVPDSTHSGSKNMINTEGKGNAKSADLEDPHDKYAQMSAAKTAKPADSSDSSDLSEISELSKTSNVPANEIDKSHDLQKSGSGTIEIKDGQSVVQDPDPGGQPAVIVPGRHVDVFINDVQITEAIDVNSNHTIAFKPRHEPASANIEIEVDKDRMSAYGTLIIDKGSRYVIKDHDPVSRLIVEGTAVENDRLLISYEQIRESLNKEKIKFGIQEQALNQLMNAEHGQKILMASGKTGRPPVHEKADHLYQSEEAGSRDQLKIDFREQNQICSVKKGDTLVRIMPGRPGEDAVDVYGKKKVAGKVKKIVLKAGKNVSVSEDGRILTAEEDGQPVFRGNQLHILPVYETKSVNLESGNIRFSGSVIIRQNVEENMLVEAKKDVHVAGNVTMARIIAGGHVEIAQNAIGSTISAGGESALFLALSQRLKPVDLMLSQLKQNFEAAAPVNAGKNADHQLNEGHLILLLIERLFPQLGKTAEDFVSYALQHLDFEDPNRSMVDMLAKYLIGAGPAQMNRDMLLAVTQSVSEYVMALESMVSEKYTVKVKYIQNTIIETRGDIVLSGKGSYNAKLTAGGDISGLGQPGIFRGGEMYAEGTISFNELGSPSGAPTTISIGSKGHIRAKIAHPNVQIKSGPYYKKLKDTLRYFDARVTISGIEVLGS